MAADFAMGALKGLVYEGHDLAYATALGSEFEAGNLGGTAASDVGAATNAAEADAEALSARELTASRGVPMKGVGLAGARQVDVSLESVEVDGVPHLGLTSFTESGPKSMIYLGTHGGLFADEGTLIDEILVTDVHESLHAALGYRIGTEDWIDELAYWSVGR